MIKKILNFPVIYYLEKSCYAYTVIEFSLTFFLGSIMSYRNDNITFLVLYFVFNFGFCLLVKLFINFVLVFNTMLVLQSTIRCWRLTKECWTCDVLIGWWVLYIVFRLDVNSMKDEIHCCFHWSIRTWHVTVIIQ